MDKLLNHFNCCLNACLQATQCKIFPWQTSCWGFQPDTVLQAQPPAAGSLLPTTQRERQQVFCSQGHSSAPLVRLASWAASAHTHGAARQGGTEPCWVHSNPLASTPALSREQQLHRQHTQGCVTELSPECNSMFSFYFWRQFGLLFIEISFS